MRRPFASVSLRVLVSAVLLAGADRAAVAADPDAACRAQPVGSAKLMKSHNSGLGRCRETDLGNDPHRYGRTQYRKQAIGWRDRAITLDNGGAGIEEYFCRLPIGILMQIYLCPCGIETSIAGRGVCRSSKPSRRSGQQ